MAGYGNRLIRIPFPDLSEDPENDPIWITIRNPKLIPMEELQSRQQPEIGEDGNPIPGSGLANMVEIVSRLVVAWRVYDASVVGVDPGTGEPLDQPLLDLPATPEKVAKLPAAIMNQISDKMTAAVAPKSGAGD